MAVVLRFQITLKAFNVTTGQWKKLNQFNYKCPKETYRIFKEEISFFKYEIKKIHHIYNEKIEEVSRFAIDLDVVIADNSFPKIIKLISRVDISNETNCKHTSKKADDTDDSVVKVWKDVAERCNTSESFPGYKACLDYTEKIKDDADQER